MSRRLALLFVAVTLSCHTGFASEQPYDHEYAQGAGRKLERGVSNTLMGWMEVPRHIDIQGRNHGTAAAAIVGPIQGVGATLARTTAGVFDVLTFPFPLANRFEKLGHPEMVFDKADSRSGAA